MMSPALHCPGRPSGTGRAAFVGTARGNGGAAGGHARRGRALAATAATCGAGGWGAQDASPAAERPADRLIAWVVLPIAS